MSGGLATEAVTTVSCSSPLSVPIRDERSISCLGMRATGTSRASLGRMAASKWLNTAQVRQTVVNYDCKHTVAAHHLRSRALSVAISRNTKHHLLRVQFCQDDLQKIGNHAENSMIIHDQVTQFDRIVGIPAASSATTLAGQVPNMQGAAPKILKSIGAVMVAVLLVLAATAFAPTRQQQTGPQASTGAAGRTHGPALARCTQWERRPRVQDPWSILESLKGSCCSRCRQAIRA